MFNARARPATAAVHRLADDHVEPGAVPAGRARLDLPAEAAEVVGEPGRACPVRAPSSSSARTIRPLVALLKWVTTLRVPSDLVQHPHGHHPAGQVGRRSPERGVRRRAQVDDQPAARRRRGRGSSSRLLQYVDTVPDARAATTSPESRYAGIRSPGRTSPNRPR